MKYKFTLMILSPLIWLACTPPPRQPEKIPLSARALAFAETVYGPSQFFKRGETILGAEAKLKSFGDQIGLAATPKQQTFDVIILAYGEIARNIKPRMQVKYADKIIADTTVGAEPFGYEVRNLIGTGDTLLVILANDFYDPNTKEDTNLIMLNITIRTAQAGQINLFADSIGVTWDANSETDLDGYYVHLGNLSGNYHFKSGATIDTFYKFVKLKKDTTYFLAVSAFDTAGNESGKSEEVRVRLFSRNETNVCDCDGNGAVEPSDFTLFDWYYGYTRGFFLDKYSGADLLAVLAAFDRADFNNDGIVDGSDAQNFDLTCLLQ